MLAHESPICYINDEMDPWSEFRPATGEGTDLDAVAHVTHLQPGINVLTEKQLRAGLVYDESKLNAERIQVVWLSPNHWTYGYRYGSVRFEYDWRTLVRGRRAYWVEAITRYRPTACRILVTDVNRDNDSSLIPYDPSTAKGPWWYDAARDHHYWNDEYTLEVMIECNLSLTESTGLSFVDHHRSMCAINYRSCPDGFPTIKGVAGGRFLSMALGQNLQIDRRLVWRNGVEETSVVAAVHNLSWRIREVFSSATRTGTGRLNQDVRKPLARALLANYGAQRLDDARALAGMFESEADLLDEYSELISEVGGFTWTLQ